VYFLSEKVSLLSLVFSQKPCFERPCSPPPSRARATTLCQPVFSHSWVLNPLLALLSTPAINKQQDLYLTDRGVKS